MRTRHTRHSSRAFTLTELLVAVVVLIGVFLGVGKMFSTTGRIVSVGEATSDVLIESIAIEKRLREDLAKLSSEGVFVIRCVEVPNDVYVPTGGALLNPALAPDAHLRADQLLFFTNGIGSVQTYKMTAGADHKGEGSFNRIYFGHAFQLGDAGRRAIITGASPMTIDPRRAQPTGQATMIGPVSPWWRGNTEMFRTNMDSTSPQVFSVTSTQPVVMPATDARKWLLAYQPVILVRDGGDIDDYIGQAVMACPSIFLFDEQLNANSLQLMQGRLDAAASRYDNIRRQVLFTTTGQARTWIEQRNIIAGVPGDPAQPGLLYYPRAERYAPSMSRLDQALTNHVISVGCSSVKIDWTYAEGVGEVQDGDTFWRGVGVLGAGPTDFAGAHEDMQPWFGMQDATTGVFNFADYAGGAPTIYPLNIERAFPMGNAGNPIRVYEAVFGYNQDIALNAAGNPDALLGYTPWPSAIRITLTLHDTQTHLVHGREVQITIRLPGHGEVRPLSF